MFDFWLLSFFFILKINNFIDWGLGSWREYCWIRRTWIWLPKGTLTWPPHYWLDLVHLEEMVSTNNVHESNRYP
jgi:hypothetical protein